MPDPSPPAPGPLNEARVLDLLGEADQRAHAYIEGVARRPVFPAAAAIGSLDRLGGPLPEHSMDDLETLALLDTVGGPATVASTGGRYFGFVIGGTLPIASAADRLALAWDQCASSFDNSPAADAIERIAAGWVLDALELPTGSAVSFGTSASACGLACLAAARRELLRRRGWDLDRHGLANAPTIRVVMSELTHVTVRKALRVLGFGTDDLVEAPVDVWGRVDPARLPALDELTIVCLQAGEVNTGESDPFLDLIPRARAAGAWVHVDGAFGLWLRASPTRRHLLAGVEEADSWTVDAHKWLNTPYDGAMGICRDPAALAGAMNSDAAYSTASVDSQKNLGIEFSRRARGIAIWAVLRTLGREGIATLVDRHCEQARRLADGLRDAGYEVVNRVVANQVTARLATDVETVAARQAAIDSGTTWFGATTWRGRAAFRLSVSSWATTDEDIETTIRLMATVRAGVGGNSG